jgi:alkanesulfonate monooxygenase SsuD/methylene tetrahydromethanopterin reductase-like flavin-dependent oxidoreductase (luciferase family)
VSGLGTLLILGSHDDAAQAFKDLHDRGVDGAAVALISYPDDFIAFRDEILPRL